MATYDSLFCGHERKENCGHYPSSFDIALLKVCCQLNYQAYPLSEASNPLSRLYLNTTFLFSLSPLLQAHPKRTLQVPVSKETKLLIWEQQLEFRLKAGQETVKLFSVHLVCCSVVPGCTWVFCWGQGCLESAKAAFGDDFALIPCLSYALQSKSASLSALRGTYMSGERWLTATLPNQGISNHTWDLDS